MLLQAVNLTGYRLIRRTLYMLWFKFIIGLILYMIKGVYKNVETDLDKNY